jgi:hypothetical protein
MRFTSVLKTVLRGASVTSFRRTVTSSKAYSNIAKPFAAPLLIASAGYGLASSGVFADNAWIEVDAFGVDELEDGEMKAVSSQINLQVLNFHRFHCYDDSSVLNIEIDHSK